MLGKVQDLGEGILVSDCSTLPVEYVRVIVLVAVVDYQTRELLERRVVKSEKVGRSAVLFIVSIVLSSRGIFLEENTRLI